jgi:protein SCO1/2
LTARRREANKDEVSRDVSWAAGVERTFGSLLSRPLFWIAAVLAIAAWPLVWSLRTPVPPSPPVLGTVPPFALVDESGRPFGSGDLAGRAWVASFIFTRCPTVCPRITSRMARIQDRARNLEPQLHLVSFSVDPDYDTPARLAEYARGHGASPRMWTFLTGPAGALQAAVERGLRVSMGGPEAPRSPEELSHGTHLVLVDGAGRIRGYYDPEAPDVVDRIVRDAALVVNGG